MGNGPRATVPHTTQGAESGAIGGAGRAP
eukprot:COSAG01_NODE_73816_length_235_cov_12.904412_1_plen_28_part_10